eukprot:7405236-Alexandrium_andersonii.AAC.1
MRTLRPVLCSMIACALCSLMTFVGLRLLSGPPFPTLSCAPCVLPAVWCSGPLADVAPPDASGACRPR